MWLLIDVVEILLCVKMVIMDLGDVFVMIDKFKGLV